MNSLIGNKKINFLLLSLIVIFPWLFIALQGIDMSDTGYWLVGYQNFFTNVDVSKSIFSCWLTLLLGAGTNSLLGWMGFWGFKIANIIILYGMLYIVYLMLRTYTNYTLLLFFLLLTMIFASIDRLSIIFYYNLTALFFLAAGALIYFGLIKNKILLILLAGFILGLNIFVRFPNLLGIVLIVAIIYYDLAKGHLKRETLKKSILLIIGYVTGIFATLFLMHLLGHYDLYIENITELLSLSKDPSYHHSSSQLLTKTIMGHIRGFIVGFVLLMALGIFAWLSRFWNHSKAWIWGTSIFFSLIIVILLSKIVHYETKTYFWIYPGMIGIFLIILLWMAFKLFKERPELGTLAVIAYLIVELIPLGANTGFKTAIYGLYLAMPLVLIYLASLKEIKIGSIYLRSQELYFLKVFTNVFILVFSLIVGNIYFSAYHDGRSRWSMLSTVDNTKLKGTFTTKERANTLNDLLVNIKPFLDQYDSLLAYEYIPTIYYLTDANPFLDTSWPYLYTPKVLKQKLEIDLKEKGLPLVLRAKALTKDKDWPQNTKPIDTTKPMVIENRKILQNFLNKYHYQTVWENRDFELLAPIAKQGQID